MIVRWMATSVIVASIIATAANAEIPEPAGSSICQDLVFRDGFGDGPTCNIVRNSSLNLEVTDITGVYIKWSDGDYWTTHHPGHSALYDFNPWINSGAEFPLAFFWGNQIDPRSVCLSEGDSCVALNEGDIVGPNSEFSQADSHNFNSFGVHYMGFRFFYDSIGRDAYGYVQLVSFEDDGAPATITSYVFSLDGRAVVVEP